MSSPPSEQAGRAPGPSPSSFAEAGRWLLGLELFGMDFGTDRMRRLLGALGNPQRSFRAIHVVGSNGKSSTTRLADAVLRSQGTASGAYLSPHLRSWNERVLVGGAPVGEAAFTAAVARVAQAAPGAAAGGGPVTQFEALTATAFLLLAEAGVAAAVVEAGLGGRLDATNVLDAPVTVCTSVGLEHTRWLGGTVGEIATEKLDVVAPGSTLVIPADLAPEAFDVAAATAGRRDARLVVAPADSSLAPPGTPPFLRANLALALAACHAFLGAIDEGAAASVLSEGALDIPGRFEIAGRDPLTILDGAHNPDGAAALARALAGASGPVVACVAVLDDKDAEGIIGALCGVIDRFVLTSCAHPRSLAPEALGAVASRAGVEEFELAGEPHDALARARALAGRGGTAVATGSLYLIADLGRERGAGGGSTL